MFKKVKAKISTLNSDTKNQEYQAEAYKLKNKLRIIGIIIIVIGYVIAGICAKLTVNSMNNLNYSGTDIMEMMKPMLAPMIVSVIGGVMGTIGLSVYRLNKTVVVTDETKTAIKKAKADGKITIAENNANTETINDKK